MLGGLGIRWVLIGALAANRYRASPCLTGDVDLLLADAGPASNRWSPPHVPRAGRYGVRVRRESFSA
jgi:hypothetical protein